MAEITALDALQAFHQGLLSLREGRIDGAEVLNNEFLTRAFERELGRCWEKPPRNEKSRTAVKAGMDLLDFGGSMKG